MSRPYRFQAEDCFYYIFSRGDGRRNIYKNDRDCEKFIEYLTKAKEKFRFYVHAYCLMGNHYHLLIETTQANLSKMMQYLNTAYTVYYNIKRKNTGHLFQGRYRSVLVEASSYFAELTRYIHLNPVRSKLVDAPEKYHWSSYNAYIKNKNDDVDMTRAKLFLGMDTTQYCKFIQEGINNPIDPFKNIHAGFILGGSNFIKNKLSLLKNEIDKKDFAYKRALKSSITPATLLNIVSKHYKITQEDLRYSKKRPTTARQVAIYLLRKKTALTNNEIGQFFNMKSSAVSWAAIDIERKVLLSNELKTSIGDLIRILEV